jgi:hypothetical protein
MDKQLKKRRDRKCVFCGEDDYSLLDLHRIVPGEEGGKYTEHNTLVTCVKCHRMAHSGRIEVFGKYPTTAGCKVVHCEIDGDEKWLPC